MSRRRRGNVGSPAGAEVGAQMQSKKTQPVIKNLYSSDFAKMSNVEMANVMAGLSQMPPVWGNSMSWMGNQTLPQLPGANKLVLPKPDDYRTQMEWAKATRDVALVRGPLIRRRKFIISGFQHRHSDERVTKLFNRIARDTKLKKKLKEIAWEVQTVGWAVAMPDTLNVMPQAIHVMQDGISNKRALGYDNLFLEVDEELRRAIQMNQENFPKYLVEAVMKGPGSERIPLQGCYFLSSTRGVEQSFPRSPMFPLFEPLKVIENLVETQFAISFAIKQLILHVKVSGGKDASGNERPASPKAIMTAMTQVRDGAKASTIVTPTTTTLEFLSPDKEIFDAAKTPYAAAIDRINLNINIPMILVDGKSDGASYSTAVYMIKAFLQDLIDEREMLVDDFVYPWYRDIAERLYRSDKKKYGFLWNEDDQDWNIPNVIFNETELKNITELIDLLKFKLQMGTYSPQTVMESMQDDYGMERERKEAFNKDPDWVGLNFEAGMGMGIGGKNLTDSDTKHQQQLETQSQQMDLQGDLQSQQQQHQLKLQKESLKGQMQLQKQKNLMAPAAGPAAPGTPSSAPGRTPASSGQPPGRKPKPTQAGTPGRPAKPGARPRSDKTDRNPRTSSAALAQSIQGQRAESPGRSGREARGLVAAFYQERKEAPGRNRKHTESEEAKAPEQK